MKDLCRTCGEIPLNSDLKNLFNDIELVAFVKNITGMRIINKEELPSSICNVCDSKLNEMVSFQKRCTVVQNFFNFNIWKKLKAQEVSNKNTSSDPLINEEDLKLEVFPVDVDSVSSSTDNSVSVDHAIQKDILYSLDIKESLEEINTPNTLSLDELFEADELDFIGITNEVTHRAIIDDKQEDQYDIYSTEDKEGLCIEQKANGFICDICGKQLRNPATLKRHILTHNAIKRFKCRKCTKAYHTLYDLDQHIRIHTDNHPYVCRFCSAKFTYPNAKRRHEKIHTNERPHKCLYCGKRFIASSAHKQHEATHTRTKNFRCITCGFWTSSQKQLARHFKTKRHKRNENEQDLRLQEMKLEIVS